MQQVHAYLWLLLKHKSRITGLSGKTLSIRHLEAEVSLILVATGSPLEDPSLSGIQGQFCQLCHFCVPQLSPLHSGGHTQLSRRRRNQAQAETLQGHSPLSQHPTYDSHFLPRPPDPTMHQVP